MMKCFSLRHLAAAAFSIVSSVALAQSPADWGEMVPGNVYPYEAKTPVEGVYTPAESGMIRCYSSGSVISPYSDAEHTQILESLKSYYSPSGEKVRVYSVAQDQTLYFFDSFPLDGGEFRFAVGKEEIELAGVSPAPSDMPLSMSVNYRLSIMFSIPVKCTKCKLEIDGTSADVTVDASDSMLTVNWFNTIMGWYREGKIKDGDMLTVTLSGIRDENDSSNRPDFGDGLGKLVLNYKMAAKPAELVREINTPADGVTDFFSYYLPDGEEGLVSLVFDSPLSLQNAAHAQVEYGDPDNLDFGVYVESVPVSIDGSTLTADLRGVTRFPEDMIPGLPPLPNIYLSIYDIKSEDGQYVLTGQMSNPYSFGFSYDLKSVVYSIAADWLPLPGSILAADEDMEIWVLNGNRISFDSVDFSFKRDGEDVIGGIPYADLAVKDDPDYADAVIYSLKAPDMEAYEDSDIIVTFGGLKCADGLDHTSDIRVRYYPSGSGVEGIPDNIADDRLYDLNGRRIAIPSKGIRIRNGKKFIVN